MFRVNGRFNYVTGLRRMCVFPTHLDDEEVAMVKLTVKQQILPKWGHFNYINVFRVLHIRLLNCLKFFEGAAAFAALIQYLIFTFKTVMSFLVDSVIMFTSQVISSEILLIVYFCWISEVYYLLFQALVN